jgi:mono/diheme cytochrome c family protein
MRLLTFVILSALVSILGAQIKIVHVPPVKTDPASGAQMYRAYCAVCHGVSGTGIGVAAPGLDKHPTDLTRLAADNSGKFPELRVYNSILGDTNKTAHSAKDMPVWSGVLKALGQDENKLHLRVHNITKYVESLQAPVPAGNSAPRSANGRASW